MGLTKTIEIDGKQVPFKASAAIPRIYRIKFHRDVYKDLAALEKAVGKNAEENSNLDMFSLEMFENIAYIMADGNYTKICYIGGLSTVLSLGISKIETMLSQAYPKGTTSPFIRLGRSVIINQMFLYDINVLKQHLVLSDCLKNSVTLKLPKPLLKKYKDMVSRSSNITVKK